MNPPLHIRQLQPADNVHLAEMIRGVFDEHRAPQKGTVYSDPTTDHLYELFTMPKSVLWVAENDEQIMGCCGVYPTDGLPSDTAELVKLYLPSTSRGKGIGRKLMEKSISSAIEFGYKKLYLESLPQFATAVSMYEKSGFKLLDAPMGNSGHTTCNIWMIKEL